jgi:transcriptional regulator with XRE-family HTH domain
LTTTKVNWCQLIKELRKEAGISQKDLAVRAQMTQRTVAEYENVGAGRQLSVQKIEAILDALGYEMDVFLKVRYGHRLEMPGALDEKPKATDDV